MPAPLSVLFDLDGTLVDTVPFILASVRHAFDGYGMSPSEEEWLAGIGTPLRAQLACFARRPEDVETLQARYREFWRAEHDRMTRCFPGAKEIVAELSAAGHPLAVVTAKTEEGAFRTLRHTGLLPLFGVVVGADSCGRAKPDPEPVHLALSRLGSAPRRAMIVGDSLHDLAAGRAAGVLTVAAVWGACTRETLRDAAPDRLLEDIRDLPGVIAALDREGSPSRIAPGPRRPR